MIKSAVLSDRDKKKVLSAKKKQKVVLKNVLAQPFERYWPELSADDVDHFVHGIRGLCKSISRSDSIATTNTIAPTATTSFQQNVPKSADLSGKVILGLRSSIRCASSGKTVALFISSKIRPKYIVDQIIIMVVTKNPNSRILCVPDMDVALLDVLGFSCQCLAVVDDQNEIWNWSVEKSKQFALPKSFQQSKQPVTDQMDINVEPVLKPAVINRDEIDVSALYLRKENGIGRAFIPSGAISAKVSGNDFISLGGINLNIDTVRPKHRMISKGQTAARAIFKPNALTEKFLSKHKMQTTHKQRLYHQQNKFNYLALKVNRIQANPDKIRNKKNKKSKKIKK